MELWLVDIYPVLVEAWQREFAGFQEVHVVEGKLWRLADNTVERVWFDGWGGCST